MKIEVKRNDLLRILEHVQSVVEKRNAIPILSNVKIAATSDGTLELEATDMDISISDNVKCTVQEAGSITLPAATFYEIVRKSSEKTDVLIDSTQQPSLCLITIGTSEFNLPTLPAEEFPSFQVGKATNKFHIHSEILKTLLAKTRHAISNDETRYYLNGIYLHPATSDEGSQVLRAVSTDGHRLARAQTLLPEGCDAMAGVIIPKKTVGEIVKLLESYVGDVEVSLSDKKISMKIGTTDFYSKLIDGKFPDYERVIPKNNDKYMEVSRENLLRSIDLVISISNDKTRAVKFNIEPSKLTVLATSEINGNSKGVQEMPVNYNSKEVITIDFNSRYVLDSLGAIDGDTVRVALSSGAGAVIAQDANESNCIYILMPMQV
jgi:DNA polymerase-3 subunit beta